MLHIFESTPKKGEEKKSKIKIHFTSSLDREHVTTILADGKKNRAL